MIDDAQALNSKKQNDGIGFLNRDDEEEENPELGEDGGKVGAAVAATTDADLLGDVLNKRTIKSTRGDEEEKVGAQDSDDGGAQLPLRHKPSDPLSASQKIAEMGLSRSSGIEQAAAKITREELKDFGAILSEGGNAEDDSDSEDLF